jgi:osmoprotectant transport system ATP-binding protein
VAVDDKEQVIGGVKADDVVAALESQRQRRASGGQERSDPGESKRGD